MIEVSQDKIDNIFMSDWYKSYIAQCDNIVNEAKQIGIIIDRFQAREIWSEYSSERSAHWLNDDVVSMQEVRMALEVFIKLNTTIVSRGIM